MQRLSPSQNQCTSSKKRFCRNWLKGASPSLRAQYVVKSAIVRPNTNPKEGHALPCSQRQSKRFVSAPEPVIFLMDANHETKHLTRHENTALVTSHKKSSRPLRSDASIMVSSAGKERAMVVIHKTDYIQKAASHNSSKSTSC